MSEKITKVPAIRFKGFTDPWEQRKLGDAVQIIMGQSPRSQNYTDNPNDHVLVQGNSDMKNGRVIPRVWTTQITKKAYINDLILSVRAPVGDVGKTDYNVVLGRGVAAIKGNEFIFQTLIRFQQNGYWNKLSTGSTFESINSADIKEALISLPDEREQWLIGDIFMNLDNLITLQQRELDLMKKQKQTLLSKMFPKTGEQFPEIRFKGFTDPWEQCKLGDLGSVAMNKRIFKEQTSDSGDIPFFKIGTFGKGPDAYISRKLFEEYKSKYPYPEVGDTLISASGTIGRAVVYSGEEAYFQDSNIVWLKRNKSQLDADFLRQWYNVAEWENVEGSTIKRLYNSNILSTNISLPNLEEQSLIGNFFDKLDMTITLQQRKLDQMKIMKKSLLKAMFV